MSNLPKGWEEVKLGEILNIQTGKKNAQDSKENGEYPFFTRSIDTQKIDTYSFDTEALFIAGEGNFTVKYYKGKFDLHQRTYMLTALKENTVDLKFLQNNIQPKVYQLVATSVGSTVQSLRKPIIEALKIPLPPLEEQKKIANILSTVDKKIAFVEENINATEELKKGLMQKLLTEGICHTEFKNSELGRIPESWEIIELGKHIKLMGGYAFKSQDSTEQGVKWLKIANVGIQEIKWEQNSYLPINFIEDYSKFLLQPNDIVLAMTRPILNNKLKIAKINDNDLPALLNQRVGKFIFDSKVYSEFMYYLFQHIDFVKILMLKILGTDPPNVGSEQIESINIVFPPLEEQKQIAEILSTVDNKLENLKEKKQSFEELKKGLMQKLLTGEVRV